MNGKKVKIDMEEKDNIMQLVNEKEQRACLTKVYGEPTLKVTYFYGDDVITESNPNDNNYGDIDWS